MKALVKRGIDAGRLTAKGYGQDMPIADNTTDAGRQKNRRVQFTIVEKQAEGDASDMTTMEPTLSSLALAPGRRPARPAAGAAAGSAPGSPRARSTRGAPLLHGRQTPPALRREGVAVDTPHPTCRDHDPGDRPGSIAPAVNLPRAATVNTGDLDAAASLQASARRRPPRGQHAHAPPSRSASDPHHGDAIAAGDVDPARLAGRTSASPSPRCSRTRCTRPTQQPYYFVQVTNVTKNTLLYTDFNLSAQAGVPWKTINGGTPQRGRLRRLVPRRRRRPAPRASRWATRSSSRSSRAAAPSTPTSARSTSTASAPTIPGLFVSGTGAGARRTPALEHHRTTCTVQRQRLRALRRPGWCIDFTTPPGTTFQSFTAPAGATCVAPAVGTRGHDRLHLRRPRARRGCGRLQHHRQHRAGHDRSGRRRQLRHPLDPGDAAPRQHRSSPRSAARRTPTAPAGNWCNEAAPTACTPKLANGTAMPTDGPHMNPTLNGMCTAAAAHAGLRQRRLRPADNKCGLANGDGLHGDGGVVCRSASAIPTSSAATPMATGPARPTAARVPLRRLQRQRPLRARGRLQRRRRLRRRRPGATRARTPARPSSPTARRHARTPSSTALHAARTARAVHAAQCGRTATGLRLATTRLSAGVCDRQQVRLRRRRRALHARPTAGVVCRSGACSVNGVCEPAGGCDVDADCTGGNWCNETHPHLHAEARQRRRRSPPTGRTRTRRSTARAPRRAGDAGLRQRRLRPDDNACGYANGDGPCTAAQAAPSCAAPARAAPNGTSASRRAAATSTPTAPPASGATRPTHTCTPKLANGSRCRPIAAHTNPTLDGTCTPAAGALVCSSGVCDTKDNDCGYANGDGPCTGADGDDRLPLGHLRDHRARTRATASPAPWTRSARARRRRATPTTQHLRRSAPPHRSASGATPVCDATSSTCVPCNGDQGSGTPDACTPPPTPSASSAGSMTGQCGKCMTNADCTGHSRQHLRHRRAASA